MSNKELLSQTIKQWIKLDNEIKLLQNEIKGRRKKKNELTNSLVKIMKTNEIDCVDMNEGKILYTQSTIKKSINKNYLLESLEKYFKNNPNVSSDDVVEHILTNRQTNIKEGIRHKLSKNI